MVVPFLIIYLFNWVMFLVIIVSLLRKHFLSNVKSKKDAKTLFFHQQLIIAITLSVLFGLGWGIGLFATQDIHTNKTVRDILAALFVVFTAFHGLFIFIMQCLCSKDIRNSWKRCFLCVTRKDISELTSSTISRKHQKECQHSSNSEFIGPTKFAAEYSSKFVNEYAAMKKQFDSGESKIPIYEISDPSHILRSKALQSVTKADEEGTGDVETTFTEVYFNEIEEEEIKTKSKEG